MNKLLNINKETLYDLYIKKNLSPDEIERELKISHSSFTKYIKQFNISKPKQLIKECRKRTNLRRYGVDNPSKSPETKEKISLANKSNKDIIIEKRRKTNLEKYGSATYNNMEKNKATKILNHGDPYYNGRDEYRKTMIEKYDVDNGFKLPGLKKQNINKLCVEKGYSDEFKDLISNRDKSIKYLVGKNLNYFDLTKIFNAPYYIIQNWVFRLNLQDYINYKFDGRSHYEDDIVKYLETVGVENIQTNIKILGKEEADIYLPDNNLIIEFDGTYWHSDLFKAKNYHLNKSLLAEKLGYRLIHIYQYEWDDTKQKEKIKQLLRIACGKVKEKIYARNCDIRIISNKEAKELNDNVHLQGHRNAKVTYGLFYKNELVQLMSFSKKKRELDSDWEIIRGCPGSNNIVIGGVSKLFKHFIDDYNPSSIFSYCDFNKFNGKSYEELGMEYIGSTGPDLTYIIKGKTFKRQYSNYKNIKNKVDYRIWGAGSKKYLWKNANQ